MKKNLVLVFILNLALISCSHTNYIKRYNLRGESIYFEERVTTKATQVVVNSHKKSKEKEKSNLDIFKDVAVTIGGMAVSADTEKKLQRAANTRKIAESVSSGIENGLVKYLRVRPVRNLDNRSNYIVTTIIEDCKLVSNKNGIYVSIRSTTQLCSRNSGRIIWENTERESVPLKRSLAGIAERHNNTLSQITQLAELAALSEEEIASAISAAAIEVGYEMSETLRRDIAAD